MPRDPRFPDRPDSPSFWELSQAVIDNDNDADGGADAWDQLISRWIDVDSVAYVAGERTKYILSYSRQIDDASSTPIVAAWVDGFSAAMRMVENRQPRDGQHRHG